MGNGTISLHLLVKNEIALLGNLVQHVRPYVNEVVITDTGSTDGTYELAQRIADIAHRHPLKMDFAQARNAGLERCRGAWVLALDADEWPTTGLLMWLKGWSGRADGVRVLRENLVDGQPIGAHTYEWHVRFFRQTCRYYRTLHEIVDAKKTIAAPREHLLLHHKTSERQERQDRFYAQWRH